ncbi:unnamed protein product [Clonostachys rosea f. rosea IK726]|uniref:Uncharacterized protein n=1 Tax=Clonostachys rosea f. rosea IK726 TaxID=1349383 RepID=A0ACA9U0K3_BIOOC|nr:unnamed protein product [Clonostachys rosea f. rosea IK726]
MKSAISKQNSFISNLNSSELILQSSDVSIMVVEGHVMEAGFSFTGIGFLLNTIDCRQQRIEIAFDFRLQRIDRLVDFRSEPGQVLLHFPLERVQFFFKSGTPYHHFC